MMHDHPIHDQHCRCHGCKPGAPRPFSTIIAPHHPVPPHVRKAMDRIVMAVLLLACVCALCIAMGAA